MHVMQKIVGKGFELLGRLAQPGLHGVRIDLKHPSYGPDA